MINVGVIGVGNCFAGLYQGIEFYKRNSEQRIIGLMHQKVAGYDIHDIKFTSAFDIGENKVGKKLHVAQAQEPNTVDWVKNMPESDVVVKESPILDGVGIYVEDHIKPIKSKKTVEELKKEVEKEIKDTNTKILISYLPVGSQKVTEFWAEVALDTGCAFINCMPVFIASTDAWRKKFEEKKIPIIGDDVKSQVGATIIHRVLAKLCDDRGAKIDKTYQINVGGNTDFLNMKEQSRLVSKKISKTEAVQSQLQKELKADKIYIGPSDFIPFLGNTKLCFCRVEGRMFANIPFNVECRLEVDDKANSGGVLIDAIRCAQIALDKGIGGNIEGASAYFMKHPPIQHPDSVAKDMVEKFIKEK